MHSANKLLPSAAVRVMLSDGCRAQHHAGTLWSKASIGGCELAAKCGEMIMHWWLSQTAVHALLARGIIRPIKTPSTQGDVIFSFCGWWKRAYEALIAHRTS